MICKRLVLGGVYPSARLLAAAIPHHANNTLTELRDELVATGALVIPPEVAPCDTWRRRQCRRPDPLPLVTAADKRRLELRIAAVRAEKEKARELGLVARPEERRPGWLPPFVRMPLAGGRGGGRRW